MTDQNNTNKTLGQFLAETRESRGFSIEQVASETKISARILKSIEADRYHDLPAKAFVRGFINSYAKLLHIDKSIIEENYKTFLEEKLTERPDKSGGHSGYTFEEKEHEQNRRWLGGLAIAGLVFVLGALFVLKPKIKHRGHKPESETKISETTTASTVPTDLEKPEIKAQPDAPTTVIGTETVVSKNTVTIVAPTVPTPAATAAPTNTPTSTPTPTTENKPEPTPVVTTPSPVPTPSPAAAVQAVAEKTETKPDPLQKGDDLAAAEVQVRTSFRSDADQYVTYQVDNKSPVTLILRAGKFLVLKGKEKIIFDSQNPEKLVVRYAPGGPYSPLKGRGLVSEKGKSVQILSEKPNGLPNTPNDPPPPGKN